MAVEIIKSITEVLKFSFELFKNKNKGIDNYKSTIDIVEKESKIKPYYRDLVSSYFIENDFYLKTGIQTNINSIDKYYHFKNKLSRNYTWASIKLVKPHLNLDEDEININLTKVEKIYSKIISVISFLLIFMSIGIMMYVSNVKVSEILYQDILFKIMATLIPALIGISLLYGVMSIQIARRMKIDLNKSKTPKKEKDDL